MVAIPICAGIDPYAALIGVKFQRKGVMGAVPAKVTPINDGQLHNQINSIQISRLVASVAVMNNYRAGNPKSN